MLSAIIKLTELLPLILFISFKAISPLFLEHTHEMWKNNITISLQQSLNSIVYNVKYENSIHHNFCHNSEYYFS